MANFEEVAVSEQRRILRILSQFATEFFARSKERMDRNAWKAAYRGSDDYEKFQLEFEKNPEGFHVLEVTEGSEQEFEDYLEKNNIDYSYINATYLEAGTNGRIIVRDKDFVEHIQTENWISIETLYKINEEDRLNTKISINDEKGGLERLLTDKQIPFSKENGTIVIEADDLAQLDGVVSKQCVGKDRVDNLINVLGDEQMYAVSNVQGELYTVYLFDEQLAKHITELEAQTAARQEDIQQDDTEEISLDEAPGQELEPEQTTPDNIEEIELEQFEDAQISEEPEYTDDIEEIGLEDDIEEHTLEEGLENPDDIENGENEQLEDISEPEMSEISEEDTQPEEITEEETPQDEDISQEADVYEQEIAEDVQPEVPDQTGDQEIQTDDTPQEQQEADYEQPSLEDNNEEIGTSETTDIEDTQYKDDTDWDEPQEDNIPEQPADTPVETPEPVTDTGSSGQDITPAEDVQPVDYTPQPEPDITPEFKDEQPYPQKEPEYHDTSDIYKQDTSGYQQETQSQPSSGGALSQPTPAETHQEQYQPQISITNDQVVGSDSDRKRDSLYNAVYNAVDRTDEAVKETALSRGLRESEGTFAALSGGALAPIGISTLTGGTTVVNDIKTFAAQDKFLDLVGGKDNLNTLEKLMKADAAQRGKDFKGFDFSTAASSQRSMEEATAFFSRNKYSEQRTVANTTFYSAVKGNSIYDKKIAKQASKDLKGVGAGGKLKGHTADSFSKKQLKQLSASKVIGKDKIKSADLDRLNSSLRNTRKMNSFLSSMSASKDSIKAAESMQLKRGGSKGLLDNKYIKDSLKDDATGQTFYKMKDSVDNAHRVVDITQNVHEVLLARKTMRLERSAAKAARKVNGIRRVSGTSSAQYRDARKKFNDIQKKRSKTIEKHKKIQEKLEQGGSKNRLKKSMGNSLKDTKLHRKIKETKIYKPIRKIKKINEKLAVKKAAIIKKIVPSPVRSLFGAFSKAKMAVIKALTPIITFLAKCLLVLALIILIVIAIDGLIGHLSSHMNNFFVGDDGQYPVKLEETTFHLLYNELVKEEIQWENTLKNKYIDPTKTAPLLGSLNYTPNVNGRPDLDHQNLDVKEYITDWMHTDYREESMISFRGSQFNAACAKGPEPFEGAPEEAYKWIKIIDGSVQLQMQSVGDSTAGISNVHEILAMASVASLWNDIPAHHSPYAEDVTTKPQTFLDGIRSCFTKVKHWVNMVRNKFDEIGDRLLSTLPGIDNLWANYRARKNMKLYSMYTKPLFDQSHREFYALRMRILPTKRTASSYDYNANSMSAGLHSGGYTYSYGNNEIYDAVNMQSDQDELYLMAKIVQREAGNQPYEGQVAVAQVIKNRVMSSRFPNTITGVVSAPKQFATYNGALSMSNSSVDPKILDICNKVMNQGLKVFDRDDVIGFHSLSNRDDIWNGWYNYTNIAGHAFYSLEPGNADAIITNEDGTQSINYDLEANLAATVDAAEGYSWGFTMCSGNEKQTQRHHDDHQGYGCKSYDKFAFKYDSDDRLYYNNIYEPGVEPACQVDKPDDVCVAPGNNPALFCERIDLHEGCWEYMPGSDDGWNASGGSAGYSSRVVEDHIGGEGYVHRIYSDNGGKIYTVDYITDSRDDDGDGEDDHWYHKKMYFGHNCDADHTGYYCGGHMDLYITGGVYHITDTQRRYNHDNFEEKPSTKDPETPYIVGDTRADMITGYVKYVDMNKHAKDLFDIDSSIAHATWAVHPDFNGWIYDFMDFTISKLDEDWYTVYNIGDIYTVGGEATTTGIMDPLSSAYINDILDYLDENNSGSAGWDIRRAMVERALSFVGKISYSQAYHGSALTVGGQNDCSGFASRVWESVLGGKVYTTSTFRSTFTQRNFTDGGAKPGDILLHFPADGAAHALIYAGKDSHGNDMVVDCSGGGVKYRNRGKSYYNGCTYIDMSALM